MLHGSANKKYQWHVAWNRVVPNIASAPLSNICLNVYRNGPCSPIQSLAVNCHKSVNATPDISGSTVRTRNASVTQQRIHINPCHQ
jgi:hypothetical protein